MQAKDLGVLASWVGIAITLLSGFWYIGINPINKNIIEISKDQQEFIEKIHNHTEQGYHSVARVKIENNEKNIQDNKERVEILNQLILDKEDKIFQILNEILRKVR